jgi:hypothetical protein
VELREYRCCQVTPTGQCFNVARWRVDRVLRRESGYYYLCVDHGAAFLTDEVYPRLSDTVTLSMTEVS